MGKNYVNLEEMDAEEKHKTKVIAVMNNKGGCGKTTTAMALGMYLARTGNNVLFWDGDPQCNLTQRLGIPDEKKNILRIDELFLKPDKHKDISKIQEYPHLQRVHGSKKKIGKIGIVPGTHSSEMAADFLEKQFSTFGRDQQEKLGYPSLAHYIQDLFNFYLRFYHYIVMDTAPALEGNRLNMIAVRTADEIIYPIDGIEAALGIRQILNWMDTQTATKQPRPNGLFAMVKYQSDTKGSFEVDKRSRNSVYRIMKEVFNDFTCDNGVKELASLRHGSKSIPGFGGKTQYTALCEEITNIINRNGRENLFDFVNKNGAIPELEKRLSQLSLKATKRAPVTKKPKYIPKPDTQQVQLHE